MSGRHARYSGDDIGWSAVGCTNYKSGSGGDPINLSGTKGRGSYRFSASQPAGRDNQFIGGTLSAPGGRYVSISSNGTCTSSQL